MKKTTTIIIILSFLMLPGICVAAPCGNPASIINIDGFAPFLKPTKVQEALTNYASYPGDGQHELCFQMSTPLTISSASSVKAFALNVSGSDNVYVTGLKLNRSDDLAADIAPLLSINNGGTEKAIIAGISLTNVRNGLALSGNGAIEVGSYNDNKTVITGSPTKSGSCIDVKSPGAVLSAVQASSCGEGIKVDADNVAIKNNSAIFLNSVGIHVVGGRNMTDVVSSRIYANNDGNDANLWRYDGIRFDEDALKEIFFYDVVNNEPVPLLDGEDVINYENRKPYLLIDIPEGKTGKVEFLLSVDNEADGTCNAVNSYKQACSSLEGMTNPVSVSADSLASGPVEVTIPASYLLKKLVAIYTDPERGTAGISRQFTFSANDGVVAFVANPYDIPTSGGAVDTGSSSSDDEEEQTTGGSGMDGVNTAGEGSNLIDAAGGPSGCGGGASIMALSWRDSSIAGVLWFLIVISAAIASLRLVRVRFKRGQR